MKMGIQEQIYVIVKKWTPKSIHMNIHIFTLSGSINLARFYGERNDIECYESWKSRMPYAVGGDLVFVVYNS